MSLPLQIELRSSRLIRASQWMLAASALLALWLSAAPTWALLLVPVVLWLGWPRRVPGRHASLTLHPDGAVTGVGADGAEAALLIHSLQWRGPLCVLTVVDAQKRHRHLLTPEALSPEQSRALRLWFDRFDPAAPRQGAAVHV